MSNRHEDARIGEQKIFHETDVHHCAQENEIYKVGIKRFCAQENEMSLTAIMTR